MQSSPAEKIALSWSSGKDAALALWRLQAAGRTVTHLFTTVSTATDRVVMHGVRPELVQAQAAAIGLPLLQVPLPPGPDAAAYEAAMLGAFRELQAAGVTALAFGDIFLEDLRAYRMAQAHAAGLQALFPLWGQSTPALVEELEQAGIDARVICLNRGLLDEGLLGCRVSAAFAAALPAGVDACGERGEYHSFVSDARFFKQPVRVAAGAVVQHAYPAPGGGAPVVFSFLDLQPVQAGSESV